MKKSVRLFALVALMVIGGQAMAQTRGAMFLGASFPVSRTRNYLNVAVDLGQRGTKDDNLIRERFINFTVGINIFDIWFIKPKYD